MIEALSTLSHAAAILSLFSHDAINHIKYVQYLHLNMLMCVYTYNRVLTSQVAVGPVVPSGALASP